MKNVIFLYLIFGVIISFKDIIILLSQYIIKIILLSKNIIYQLFIKFINIKRRCQYINKNKKSKYFKRKIKKIKRNIKY